MCSWAQREHLGKLCLHVAGVRGSGGGYVAGLVVGVGAMDTADLPCRRSSRPRRPELSGTHTYR